MLPLSHDEVVHGKGSLLNKMPGDEWQQFANLRALFGFMWGHPGKKLLFMGGELGAWDEWDHEKSLDWHLADHDAHRGFERLLAHLARTYRGTSALHALDAGDRERFQAILAPTLPLSRHVFGAPTRFYKTGVVFMAYLNGHQSHFRMVGGMESARSVVHLAELFVLADRAGLFADPERAATRMRRVLAVAGVE